MMNFLKIINSEAMKVKILKHLISVHPGKLSAAAIGVAVTSAKTEREAVTFVLPAILELIEEKLVSFKFENKTFYYQAVL